MPKYWYDYRACQDNDYQKSICCEKKPYFMIYRYDEERKKYKSFIKEHDIQCMRDFGVSIETLLKTSQSQLTQEQKDMIHWFNYFNPVDMGQCTINKICFYIEKEIKEYKSKLKERKVNWEKFKTKRRCTTEHKNQLQELMELYISKIENFSDEFQDKKSFTEEYFQSKAKEICPNKDERRNIMLDLCYGKNNKKSNKEFCWMIIVDDLLEERFGNE